MLRMQIIGLALVAALVMSAVAVGSASATVLPHEWLINGTLIGSPVKIHSQGLLVLTDDTAPGGATSVHCHGFNAGTVGPHALDLISSITKELLGTLDKIPCNYIKQGACESSPVPLALAVNLPWHTELTLFGSEVRDMIMKDVEGGNPGWSVTCKTLLGTVTDTCTSALNSTRVENVSNGVLALFDATSNANPAECKVGAEGARKAGLVSGAVLIESPSSTQKLTFE
jgi:hypothetical protein